MISGIDRCSKDVILVVSSRLIDTTTAATATTTTTTTALDGYQAMVSRWAD